MTNEPILLRVVPHSVDSEFLPQIEKYRGIVEEELFARLGRPSFFDEAVDLILGRVAARMGQQGTANSKSTACAFAPQVRGTRDLAEGEARRFVSAIERQFVETGVLALA